MRTWLIFICGCLLSCEPVAQTPNAVIKRLEREMPLLIQKGEVPGISLAYISNGHLVWHKAFGVTSSKTRTPVADNSVFEAASLSKPVAAYAVMKLVDEGKIDIDKPLSQYLTTPYPGVYDARINQITARHVLSHTTGFPNWRNGDTLKIYFNPGARFSYSGEGFVYLSKVMESITGEKFDALMKQMVFDPLGMNHSSFSWKDEYDDLKVFCHNTRGEAVSQNKMDRGNYNAAASLHTTAADYGKFVEAILSGKGLKPKTLQEMLTPISPVFKDGTQTVRRPDAQPFPGVSWALGWGIQEIDREQSFFHWGDNGDFKALIVALEKQKNAIVVFTNSAYGSSIGSDVVKAAWNVDVPAMVWLREERYDSPSRQLFRDLVRDGAAVVLPKYLQWRKGQPAGNVADEDRMNRIGLDLLKLGKVADAIAVLKQNVIDHPDSFNVYDSLGEAYAEAGDKERAIENYETSVRMNPGNKWGVDALKKLRGK